MLQGPHIANSFYTKVYCSIILSVIFCSPCLAQSSTVSKKEAIVIDSLMKVFMLKNSVPGASVAIVKNKTIVWEKGYGMADIEKSVPATASTVYRLASVSKPITAVAVMQLVEQGKIALDSPIQKYVPAFPIKKYPITTRELLSHMTGIRHYQGDEFNITRSYKTLTEALDIFKNDSLLQKPGEQQIYSTYGYTLLGVIIEAVSGKTFMDYLKDNIFKPAGMTHTYEDEPLKIIPNRSAPYDTISKGVVGNSAYVNTSYKIPGGGIISDVNDMSRFMIALQQGKLVKPATWKQMTTEVKTAKGGPTYYGFGWIIGFPPVQGLPNLPSAVWHGGVQQGSTSAILMLLDKGIDVVILSNLGELGNEITMTTALIASSLRNKN
ncbi:MAG: serine hydrolase domain-containing protein [Mucilaginibacter sp.]|uniref:serine hydrolase domain-containing protein n=1 Tax=Mucilaginibacter sp. TaxID=1882438 RepID=UPI0034E3C12F